MFSTGGISKKHNTKSCLKNSSQYNASKDELIGNYKIGSYSLGSGAFGGVYPATKADSDSDEIVAVKIINNGENYVRQSKIEVLILDLIKKKGGNPNIVNMIETFEHLSHPVIIFELHGVNLYRVIKNQLLVGYTVIKHIIKNILDALDFLKTNLIVHSDLKPENIVLKSKNNEIPDSGSIVKIIDLGSAMFNKRKISNFYMQTRYYRSPEVVLNITASYPIDMWSLGCIVYEMIKKLPLFPAKNTNELINYFTSQMGLPQYEYLEKSTNKNCYRKDFIRTITVKNYGIDKDMASFINSCICWDPKDRIDVSNAVNLEWVKELDDPTKQQPITKRLKVTSEV